MQSGRADGLRRRSGCSRGRSAAATCTRQRQAVPGSQAVYDRAGL
jgi:hypothetical protein